jgi:DNA-binding response OmpR family regulator
MYLTNARNDGTVVLVEWPRDRQLVENLRAAGVPRLLMLTDDAIPPICIDELQDWIRVPADPREVNARVQALERRVARRVLPSIDDNGHLAVAVRWVALTPIETAMMRLLVANFDKVVSRTAVVDMWADAQSNRNQFELRLRRLRDRIRPVGLKITTYRTRGYALQWADESSKESLSA